VRSFNVLFILTGFGTVLLALRELLQAIFSWKSYSRSRENILEFVIIVTAFSYLVAINTWLPTAYLSLARHLAAWSVFFGWLELTMLIGRFPSIGIYIYMSVHVIKTLLLFILVNIYSLLSIHYDIKPH
jgi:hypothetical protein